MSWTLAVPAGPANGFETRALVSLEAYKKTLAGQDYTLSPETEEAVTVAIKQAKAIVTSGIVGKGLVGATLSGHANPDHKPVKGWSNDFVTITVACSDVQPTS